MHMFLLLLAGSLLVSGVVLAQRTTGWKRYTGIGLAIAVPSVLILVSPWFFVREGPRRRIEDVVFAQAPMAKPAPRVETAEAKPPVAEEPPPTPIEVHGAWPGPWHVSIRNPGAEEWQPSGIWTREGRAYAHSGEKTIPGLQLGLRVGNAVYGVLDVGADINDPRGYMVFPSKSGQIMYRLRGQTEAQFVVIEPEEPVGDLLRETKLKQWKQGPDAVDAWLPQQRSL